MRLLLHVGMPKAGTSAMQSRLRANRGKLLRRAAVLYPEHMVNHNFLAGAVYDINKMPRLFRQTYGGDNQAFKKHFEEFWSAIRASVERRRPKTLLLSAETLCGPMSPEAIARLRSLLKSIADQIEVVTYVRRPSDFYLSSAQQLLKASHQVKHIRPVPYRAKLESIATVADRMHVVEYDRSRFPSGDIALDLARRFLPEAEPILAKAEVLSVNETMSAEIMAALQDYRRHAHGTEDDVFTRDTGAFVRALKKREAALGGGQRPLLHAHVREHIDHGSPDLIWLRATHGIVFADIDYENIAVRDTPQPKRISDICPVDEARKERLIYGFIADALRPHADEPVKFHTLRYRQVEHAGSLRSRFRRWANAG